MNKEELNSIYLQLTEQYIQGVEKQDAKILNAFVQNDEFLSLKTPETKGEYTRIRLYRAECYILFGSFSDAIKECRLGLAFANKNTQWEIYMLWAKLHFIQFLHTDGDMSLQAVAEAAILVAQKGRAAVVPCNDAGYQRLSFINIEAFFTLYLGKREEAKALYSSLKFTPVPIPQYNDKEALPFLFTNFAKGLAVAIELKDEKLLRQLLRVISIDDQTLYSKESLFKIFHTTLVTTMDTHPNFATEFNQLFQLKDKTKEQLKELNFFLTSITSNMMQALELAFEVFKQ